MKVKDAAEKFEGSNRCVQSDAEKAAAALGFWTAPEDWHEMLAENAAVKLT